eukprot:2538334-Prymnesium_polylepis.1
MAGALQGVATPLRHIVYRVPMYPGAGGVPRALVKRRGGLAVHDQGGGIIPSARVVGKMRGTACGGDFERLSHVRIVGPRDKQSVGRGAPAKPLSV